MLREGSCGAANCGRSRLPGGRRLRAELATPHSDLVQSGPAGGWADSFPTPYRVSAAMNPLPWQSFLGLRGPCRMPGRRPLRSATTSASHAGGLPCLRPPISNRSRLRMASWTCSRSRRKSATMSAMSIRSARGFNGRLYRARPEGLNKDTPVFVPGISPVRPAWLPMGHGKPTRGKRKPSG